MKKKAVVLAGVFVLFLMIGLMFNFQKGMYFVGEFWKADGENTYSFYDNTISYLPSGDFHLRLDGKDMTARLTSLGEDRFRVDFSDGIAVETLQEPDMIVEIGGVILAGEMEYEITDLDSGHFQFAPVKESVQEGIYDENGNQVGEYTYLLTEDERVLDYREVIYDNPEFSTPEREVMILRNGVRFSNNDVYDKIFQNESGEYLLNADRFAMLETSVGEYINRGVAARFMLRVAGEEPEIRGSAAAIMIYVFMYLLGAVGFLFPEQTAFFGSRWQFREKPELSDMGMFAALVGSAVIMGMAIVMLFTVR